MTDLSQVMRTTFVDPSTGLLAYVVADTLVEGCGMGGTRIWPSVTMDGVGALARAMTLKLSLAELPIGGAKAGIVCDLPPGQERDRRLRSFGRLVGPLLRGGIYLGSDMGCTYRDRDLIFTAGNYAVHPVERRGPRAGKSIPCTWPELWARCQDVTGFGVAQSVLAMAERTELPKARRTVAIQGFGTVGRGAAKTLVGKDYKIVAVADVAGTVIDRHGLPLEELLAITDAQGNIDRTRLPRGAVATDAPNAWMDVEAGVLVLAAGGDVITQANVSKVTASIIGEGANLPVNKEAQVALEARKIIDVPDILANIGGAMVTALVLCGLTPETPSVDEFVRWIFDEVSTRVRKNTALAHEQAVKESQTMHETCRRIAEERRMKNYQRPTLTIPPPSAR